jgi:hypothetical protein
MSACWRCAAAMEVPWYSFFTWGFKSPLEWWRAFWNDGKEFIAPTSMVDLSKPAFRFGMSEIRVGLKSNTLDVKVSSDKSSYKVRGTAKVTIKATLPDGKPAAVPMWRWRPWTRPCWS